MTNRASVHFRIDIRSFVGDISKLREVLGCLNPEEREETENDVDSERNRNHATFEFDCSPARNPRDRQHR
jgi:hypothetical protein